MRRITVEKLIVTAVLTVWWLTMPVTGYAPIGFRGLIASLDAANTGDHLLYMVSHANIWHLLGNLFVLWIMRSRLYLQESLAIAFLCSYLPAVGLFPIGMTVGFSGVLFAIFGIKWGVYCQAGDAAGKEAGDMALINFICKALPFALIGLIIPHVNGCLHLYCLIAGFLYGRYNRHIRY